MRGYDQQGLPECAPGSRPEKPEKRPGTATAFPMAAPTYKQGGLGGAGGPLRRRAHTHNCAREHMHTRPCTRPAGSKLLRKPVSAKVCTSVIDGLKQIYFAKVRALPARPARGPCTALRPAPACALHRPAWCTRVCARTAWHAARTQRQMSHI